MHFKSFCKLFFFSVHVYFAWNFHGNSGKTKTNEGEREWERQGDDGIIKNK